MWIIIVRGRRDIRRRVDHDFIRGFVVGFCWHWKRGIAWVHRRYGALFQVHIGWKSFGSVYIGWMEKFCMYSRVVACIHLPSG